jgi:hypothetical protein
MTVNFNELPPRRVVLFKKEPVSAVKELKVFIHRFFPVSEPQKEGREFYTPPSIVKGPSAICIDARVLRIALVRPLCCL